MPPRFLGSLIVTTPGLLCLHSCGGLELLDLIVLGLIPATEFTWGFLLNSQKGPVFMIFDDKNDFLSQCLISNMGHCLERVLYKLEHRIKTAETQTTGDCPILYLGPA